MKQRKSLELYPLTMSYFIKRTQKCTKLFINHYLRIRYYFFDVYMFYWLLAVVPALGVFYWFLANLY